MRIIFLFLCISTISNAQWKQFLEEKSSNSILINEDLTFVIENESESTLTRNYEAIIKNRKANYLNRVILYYDNFQSVEEARVEILDINDNSIKKIKLKDFSDIGLGMDATASDGRMLYYEPVINQYPYKIKVSYIIKKTGSLHFPIWKPQAEEKLRLLASNFNVIDESNIGFRYLNNNVNNPEIEQIADKIKYSWNIHNIDPFEYENFNYVEKDYMPIVYLAPNSFSMSGISGNMSDWTAFGKWIYGLNQGKDILNANDLTELDNSIKNATNSEDKIRIVYEYVQNNTRYVSIQMGIGGWQPFDAEFVHSKKYGDCKALTNYTKTLLKRYGIKSYYTLINAGKYASSISPDFPNAHFNHAILTVPQASDTILLECTSQTAPFGYTGNFTSNRGALMITENGGIFINTNKYSYDLNKKETKIEINIADEQQSSIVYKCQFTGLCIDEVNFLQLYSDDALQKHWFNDNISKGNIKLEVFILDSLKKSKIPKGGFEAKYLSFSECKVLGKRLFLAPDNFLDIGYSKMPSFNREKPIYVNFGYTLSDTIVYNYPEKYFVETGPRNTVLESNYGSYQKETHIENGKVIIIRNFEIYDGSYKANSYKEFIEFINKAIKLDSEPLVLLNKT